MIKIINVLLNVVKVIMLLVCFVFTFFIIFQMYDRLNKNFIDSIPNFIPFVLLFILFSINFILKQKVVNENLFYNITCCLVFGMLLFAIFRTFNDKNMIYLVKSKYNLNFNYFSDIIAPMRFMLYGLCVSNILLIVSNLKIWNKKIEKIAE